MNQDCEIGDSFFIEEFEEGDGRDPPLFPEETKKSIYCAQIQLLSGPDQLQIENINLWQRFMLTRQDYDRLQSLGLRGLLRIVGYTCLGEAPYKARALLVAQSQITGLVDLPQPDECEVIYYQVGDVWRKFPKGAPVLKRRFRLSIDPEHKNCTYVFTESYFGSDSGGGGRTFCW